MIERADVVAARHRIAGRVRETPVLHTSLDSPAGPVPVTFKLEHLQRGGSFKIRGSLNALLNAPRPPARIVIASGGNAAIAAATAGQLLDIPCTVVVPETAPAAKLALLEELGADIVLRGTGYAEASMAADELAAGDSHALRLHAYDLPDVVAGAGVVGLEITEQADENSPVLVAVGGGGLVSGIALAVGPQRSVVAVEPEGAPTLHAAVQIGSPVDVVVDSVVADALGAKRIGSIAMNVVRSHNISSILVTDTEIVEARRYLWREFRLAVELAGATALAALCSGRYQPGPGERPVLVLCGANADPGTIAVR